MLQAAYTSLYHWSKVSTGVHLQRAYWLLTKVSISLGNASDAVDKAVKCQEMTEKHLDEMKDFDLAFAKEILARAYTISGDLKLAQKLYQKAKELSQAIQDQQDQEIFLTDLNRADWFGLT